uniref:Uncharacterized protein n=1 Tax=Klebsiella pneumoniae TaxID=573 RepID=A0A6M5ZZL4_KLEPN|nr:hypothetical protein [Klebsiella pneumoniae]
MLLSDTNKEEGFIAYGWTWKLPKKAQPALCALLCRKLAPLQSWEGL